MWRGNWQKCTRTRLSSIDVVRYTWWCATPTAFVRYLGAVKKLRAEVLNHWPCAASRNAENLARTHYVLSGEWILPDSQGVAPFQTRSM